VAKVSERLEDQIPASILAMASLNLACPCDAVCESADMGHWALHLADKGLRLLSKILVCKYAEAKTIGAGLDD